MGKSRFLQTGWSAAFSSKALMAVRTLKDIRFQLEVFFQRFVRAVDVEKRRIRTRLSTTQSNDHASWHCVLY